MDQRPSEPIEQPALVRHDLPAEEPKRPPLIFAPIWLFFRPRNFFLHYVTKPVTALTAVFALLFGLARAFDKLQIKMAQGKLTFVADSWATYWMLALLSGCLGGLLYFYLGGWWYRVRLKWCGAQDPDAQLARRLYLYASQILAIPVVIVTVIDSFTFATPMQAMQSDAMWQLILVVFPFWSVFASFRGARAIFDIGFIRALIWLAILPTFFYLIAFATLVAMLAFSPVFLQADTSDRHSFENSIISFEYPGNWYMDLAEDSHDDEAYLWIGAAADGSVTIEMYEPTGTIQEELDLAITTLEETYETTMSIGVDYSVWSGIECKAQDLQFQYLGTRYRAQVVVLPLSEEKYVDFVMVTSHDDALYNVPGFDLIELTFRPRPN